MLTSHTSPAVLEHDDTSPRNIDDVLRASLVLRRRTMLSRGCGPRLRRDGGPDPAYAYSRSPRPITLFYTKTSAPQKRSDPIRNKKLDLEGGLPPYIDAFPLRRHHSALLFGGTHTAVSSRGEARRSEEVPGSGGGSSAVASLSRKSVFPYLRAWSSEAQVSREPHTTCCKRFEDLALLHTRSLQVPPCLAACGCLSGVAAVYRVYSSNNNGRRISGRRFPPLPRPSRQLINTSFIALLVRTGSSEANVGNALRGGRRGGQRTVLHGPTCCRLVGDPGPP